MPALLCARWWPMPPRSLTPEDARAMRAKAKPRKLDPGAASAMSKARSVYGGGRPRSGADRCPCQVMTLRRAEARGLSWEHDPSCSFYRERAIIV